MFPASLLWASISISLCVSFVSAQNGKIYFPSLAIGRPLRPGENVDKQEFVEGRKLEKVGCCMYNSGSRRNERWEIQSSSFRRGSCIVLRSKSGKTISGAAFPWDGPTGCRPVIVQRLKLEMRNLGGFSEREISDFAAGQACFCKGNFCNCERGGRDDNFDQQQEEEQED